MLALLRRESFWPPSIVYISFIITHTTNYIFLHYIPFCGQLFWISFSFSEHFHCSRNFLLAFILFYFSMSCCSCKNNQNTIFISKATKFTFFQPPQNVFFNRHKMLWNNSNFFHGNVWHTHLHTFAKKFEKLLRRRNNWSCHVKHFWSLENVLTFMSWQQMS